MWRCSDRRVDVDTRPLKNYESRDNWEKGPLEQKKNLKKGGKIKRHHRKRIKMCLSAASAILSFDYDQLQEAFKNQMPFILLNKPWAKD